MKRDIPKGVGEGNTQDNVATTQKKPQVVTTPKVGENYSKKGQSSSPSKVSDIVVLTN